MTTTVGAPPSLPFARPNPLEPAPELARLRAEGPLAPVVSSTGEPAWLVTRYEEARAVLGDRRFGFTLPGMDTGGDGMDNSSLFQDPPAHTRLRRLVSAAFTPSRVARLRPRIAEIVGAHLDGMVSGPRPVDLMEALAFPVPITVIGELLGVPSSDRDHFRSWSDSLLALSEAGEAGAGEGWERLTDQISGMIGRKRARPGDDLLSALIAVRDEDDDRLTEAELLTMAIALIPTGYVTTSTGIGIGVLLLGGHGQLGRLSGDASLAATAVEEVLRYQAAGGEVARVALEEVELAGVKVAAGDKVLVSVTSANRDERRFVDADRFDIARTDNPHLTFGHGIHHCLGAALARLELQVVLQTLADRPPGLRVTAHEDVRWEHSAVFGDEFLRELPVRW